MNQAYNGRRRRADRNQALRIQNGFIEDIVRSPQGTLITISYPVHYVNDMMKMELIVLVVSTRTLIQDHRGNRMRVEELRNGMRIDAEVSRRMTASIPPQAQAYQIIVRNQRQEFRVMEGRILGVDARNQFLLVGDISNPMSVIQFIITPDTIIRNRRGMNLQLENLRLGSLVRVEHATFQTFSIPPQSAAFVVEVR
jgi:hypothetical protein